jgi:hypothetical protein
MKIPSTGKRFVATFVAEEQHARVEGMIYTPCRVKRYTLR